MGSTQSIPTPTKASPNTAVSGTTTTVYKNDVVDAPQQELQQDDTSKDKGSSNNGGGGSGSGGGCPMKQADGSYLYSFGALWNTSFPHRPGGGGKQLTIQEIEASKAGVVVVNNNTKTNNNNDDTNQQQQQQNQVSGGCPMKSSSKKQQQQVEYNVYSQPIVNNPNNNMPQNPNQLPASTQSVPLSTERVSSSIPKGGATDENTTWTYPSPQMFYNALARKGKLQDTVEEDIESVVALHNNMNEKTWKKVVEWEQVINPTTTTTDTDNKGSSSSKLLKFQGRPSDLSPKAAFKYYILGHPLPYDRHDWTVVRTDGTVQRYVIDYYYDDSRARDSPETAVPELHDSTATPSLLVDVRPALDNPGSFWYRTVAMPYARHVTKTTPFEPLPLVPTSTMKSYVKESIDVWQSIQQHVANREQQQHQQGQERNNSTTNISQQQATELATMFATVSKDCMAVQKKVDQCTNDTDCTRASIDLTICMGKIVCPLQSQTLNKVLTEDDNDSVNIDTALSRLSDCVSNKTKEYQSAKKQYPNIVR